MNSRFTRHFVHGVLTIVAVTALVAFFAPRTSLTASAHTLQPQKHQSGGGAVVYTHVATSANTTGYWTELDNKVTNNQPGAWVIVMPNRSASSNGHIIDNHPTAVWYDAMMGKWTIINQDKAPIPVGAAFNVFAVPQPLVQTSINQSGNAQSEEITLVASSSNSKSNWTYIDSLVTNGNPDAFVNVTVNWSVKGVYDPHPLGVFYDTTEKKWAIFNEGSIDPMPLGTAFNVLVDSPVINGVLLHTSATSNTSGNYTSLDEPSVTRGSQSWIFATPNFNPTGQTGAYEIHNLGVSFKNGEWVIFNEDNAAMPVNVSFDVMALSPQV